MRVDVSGWGSPVKSFLLSQARSRYPRLLGYVCSMQHSTSKPSNRKGFLSPLPFPLWLPFLFSNRGGVRNQPHPWLTDPYTTSLVHCCLISSFPVEVWFRQTDISLTEEECNWARGEIEWSTKRLISFHWLTGRPGKSFDLTHLISRWEKKRIRAPPPYRMNKEFTIDDRAILRLLLTSPPPLVI